MNGCVGRGNGHTLKSDFTREGRGKALLTERLAFRVPQDDLVFMGTASKAANVVSASNLPASHPHTGIAFLGLEVNS